MGSGFDIVVDGKPRTYRDVRQTAIEAGIVFKRERPQSEVAVRDVRDNSVTVLPGGHMTQGKRWNPTPSVLCGVVFVASSPLSVGARLAAQSTDRIRATALKGSSGARNPPGNLGWISAFFEGVSSKGALK
jgi:hypothetical protein